MCMQGELREEKQTPISDYVIKLCWICLSEYDSDLPDWNLYAMIKYYECEKEFLGVIWVEWTFVGSFLKCLLSFDFPYVCIVFQILVRSDSRRNCSSFP